MPEHRSGTPAEWSVLESFLWRDFASVVEWAEWAVRHGLTSATTSTPRIFGQAMMLHASLRSLEASHNGIEQGASAALTLNRLIRTLGVRPLIAPSGDVQLIAKTRSGRVAPVAAVLVMALEAMSSDQWRRFKLCRDESCRASYYDASRNATKTWCSMDVCGSRNKMRRLRGRRKARRRAPWTR